MSVRNPESVPIRPSATIVLAREGSSDPEILMVRRRAGDAFGDSYAFPGGVVDADECDAHRFCQGLTAEGANEDLDVVSDGLDYYCAAIRELFEETGILLAREPVGNWVYSGDPESGSLLRTLREQLNSGDLTWSSLLQTHDLRVACDALHYFAFWETPVCRPKRWATRFFLAEAPPGQDAEHDGNELTDSCWMTAAEVLASEENGTMTLPFPTVVNLRNIARHNTVAALLSWAGAQATQGVAKIRPVILDEATRVRFVIPGDADYLECDDD